MTTLTLRLDSETEAALRASAKRAGLPRARYVMGLIRGHTEQPWPASLRKLAGAWKDWEDFPTAEQVRKNAGKDAPRNAL